LFSQHCFFLLFPSMYSCRHEITICSTWSCSQKKCITDHFGSVRSDILMPLFHISLLSMLRWSSLTWPKMLQPETARCMRMAWFELLGAARLYGFSVTNLLDFLACCYVIELCGKYRSMLCKGSVNEWLLIFFYYGPDFSFKLNLLAGLTIADTVSSARDMSTSSVVQA